MRFSPLNKQGAAGPEPLVDFHVPLDRLANRILSLARTLGEAGIGGSQIETLLAGKVRAECVSCGIRIPGADLASLSIHETEGPLPQKLERVRLGYCARNGCPSRFYRVRFAEEGGVEWEELWRRSEVLSGAPSVVEVEADPVVKPRNPWFTSTWWYEQAVRRPVPLVLLALLWMGVTFRSGCSIPGFSPKARVFLVESGPGQSPGAAANNVGTPSDR